MRRSAVVDVASQRADSDHPSASAIQIAASVSPTRATDKPLGEARGLAVRPIADFTNNAARRQR
jgi:hypothetical protein